MTQRNSLVRGIIVGCLAMLALDGVRWLLTPLSHPDASAAREFAAAIQSVLCFGAGLWLLRLKQREPKPAIALDGDELFDDQIQGTATVVEDYALQADAPVRIQVANELTIVRDAPKGISRMRAARQDSLLSVQRGQVVIIRERRRDWLFVGNGTGAQGWIPTSHVDRVPDLSA